MQYRYDSMGNIIEVSENGRMICRYEYDALNRLTREDNVAFGKTTTWTYDNNGNILARYEYDITTKPTNELHLLDCETFEYGYDDNSDQLLSYNGEAFVYDLIGNPTTYRGKTATWAYGRQLTEYDGNTFAYDARGRRIAKNGITFTYDSNGNLIKQSDGLEFLYDHTGVFAVKHNNATYFYRKDAQANIVALLDNIGAVVVKYKYDAWGNCVIDASTTNTELANLNPFRYRSYYYDTETGFYFLKTRYYDPEIGRFMTIDDIGYLDPESINGLNLYACCLDNPILYSDDSGCSIIVSLLIAAGIGALIGGITGAISGIATGQTGWALVGSILGGAITGGILGSVTALGGLFGIGAISAKWIGVGLLYAVSASFGAGVASYAVKQSLSGQEINKQELLGHGIITAVQGLFSFGVGAMMGASGNWISLNKGDLKNSFTLSRAAGNSITKSLSTAATEFVKNNYTQIITRTFYKLILATPWAILKLAF